MDRRLLVWAFGLFILQLVILLFGDHWGFWGETANVRGKTDQKPIGIVSQYYSSVKTRRNGSFIWQQTEDKEILHNYDSVLTLNNSEAKLKLRNDVSIHMGENTLVVLEPQEQAQHEGLRIRFNRGIFASSNPRERLLVGSGEWAIEAATGSDLSLKTLADGQLEVQVKDGAVVFDHTSEDKRVEIGVNERVVFDSQDVKERNKISESLSLNHPDHSRYYLHGQQLQLNLKWSGAPDHLRHVLPDQSIQQYDIATKDNLTLTLSLGSHHFSVEKSVGDVSREIAIEVRPSPTVQYAKPLPRERFATGSGILFAWFPMDGAHRYRIEINDRAGEFTFRRDLEGRALQLQLPMESEFVWKVTGLDDLGFEMPPNYDLNFWVVDDPLAAPILNVPTKSPSLREPASPSYQEGRTGSQWWKDILDIFTLFKSANAADIETHEIHFSWNPVPGADHYILEISHTPDFRTPEVVLKLEHTRYVWRSFSKQNYYWRVAGGTNAGRKGLFSEPASFNLSNLDFMHPGELVEGVHLRPRLKFKGADTAAVKTSQLNNIENSPTKSDAKSTVKPIPKLPTRWQWSAGTNLLYQSYSFTGEFDASLIGVSLPSLEFRARRIPGEGVPWDFVARVTHLEWEAGDKNKLPYQPDFSTFEWRLHWIYGVDLDEVLWTVMAESLTTLKRADLEEIKPKAHALLGGGVAYKSRPTKELTLINGAGVLSNGDVTMISLPNSFRYRMSESEKRNYYLGGGIDVRVFFGKGSESGHELQTRIEFGIEWE